MNEVYFSNENYDLVKKDYNLKKQYWIFKRNNSDVDSIMMITNFYTLTLEFIFFRENPNKIVINDDNLLYCIFNRLLNTDDYIEINDEDDKRKHNSKITISRLENNIVMDTSYLEDRTFNLLLIKDKNLKRKFNVFFNEFDNVFEKEKLKSLELKLN